MCNDAARSCADAASGSRAYVDAYVPDCSCDAERYGEYDVYAWEPRAACDALVRHCAYECSCGDDADGSRLCVLAFCDAVFWADWRAVRESCAE